MEERHREMLDRAQYVMCRDLSVRPVLDLLKSGHFFQDWHQEEIEVPIIPNFRLSSRPFPALPSDCLAWTSREAV